MLRIADVLAREVLDSRGDPTVEVEVSLENGVKDRFSVPSGASTGVHEAIELRDGDEKRYLGKGVIKAVANVSEIIKPALIGKDARNQKHLDGTLIRLDGTPNKARIGANAILATSIACAKSVAVSLGMPLFEYIGGPNARVLPVPMMNIVNGGRHAENNLDIQEFMIVAIGAASFREAVRMGSEVFHSLKATLKSKGYSTGVGDEGGFAPDLDSDEEAIQLIVDAILQAGYKPGRDISITLDVAASELFQNGKYRLAVEKTSGGRAIGSNLSCEQLVSYYESLITRYPIVSIEDGMAEDDWDGWKLMTKRLGTRIRLVGDDVFVTNVQRLEEGIERGVANSVIVKPNQIGTLTETLWFVERAKSAGYGCIISNRSAETGETLLAALAVACNTGAIKAGSVCRSERTLNYNELIRIEECLGECAIYEGRRVLSGARR